MADCLTKLLLPPSASLVILVTNSIMQHAAMSHNTLSPLKTKAKRLFLDRGFWDNVCHFFLLCPYMAVINVMIIVVCTHFLFILG